MAGQQQVRDYLNRHRISTLFEDLMARLVQNLPSDPIPYLIKILQKFDDKAKKQPETSPLGAKTKAPVQPPPGGPAKKISRTSSGSPVIHRSSSTGLPSEWASGAMPGMGEDRGYERPWIQNMKKIQRSPDSSVEDSPRVRKPKKKPVATPTSPTADVEKVFKKAKEKKPTSKKLTKTSELWAADGEEPASRMPAQSDKPRPTNREQEDILKSEELSTTALSKKSGEVKTEKPKDAEMEEQAAVEQKKARKKESKGKQHKEELAQLAAVEREVETIGVIDTGEADTEPDQAGFEEATDILEDADELMDEGVSNVKPGGKKVKKSLKKTMEAQVKISMCSQCARLIKGDSASTVGPSGGFGAYTSLESSSSSDFPSSEIGGARGCPHNPTAMSDDDFESASQVAGPRQPVWESEGEDGGAHGDAKTMGHDGSTEIFRSGQIQQSSGTITYQVRQTAWVEDSDGGDDRHTSRVETLGERGRSWQRPGSDDDSSV